MAITLADAAGEVVFHGVTNKDGRCPELAAPGPGCFRLDFAVAAYFRAQGIALPDPPFLDVVSVAFGMSSEGGHYHVPLLVAPYAYSTYRGS